MKSIISNHSHSSLMPSSTLTGFSLAVVEEILAVKWPNPVHKFRELDRIDEEIENELREAQQKYSEFPCKKNRVRLLQALQTKIEVVTKEYKHAFAQKQYYTQQAAQENKMVGWGQWLRQSIQKMIGSDSLQQKHYYVGITKDRFEEIEKFSQQWHQLYDEQYSKNRLKKYLPQKIQEYKNPEKLEQKNHFKQEQLLNSPTGSCVSTLSWSDLSDNMGYNTNSLPVLTEEVEYIPLENSDLNLNLTDPANPSVILDQNKRFLLTYDAVNGSERNVYYYNGLYPAAIPITNSTLGGNNSYPIAAQFDNGQFIIVWHNNQNIFDYDVYGQCLDTNFNRIGPTFRINNQTRGRQWYPSVAVMKNSFMVAWESDNNITIEFNDSISIYEASLYSGISARFFNTMIDSSGQFHCNWVFGPDFVIASPNDVGHMTGTGLEIIATEDSTTQTDQFLISWVDQNENVYIRPFSLTGTPLRYALPVSSYQQIKVPSGISTGNLFNGKIIDTWNELVTYYNETYCNPVSYKTHCRYQKSYYNNCISETILDYNILGQMFSITGSDETFGYPALPSTPIASSPFYKETFPTIGTFLSGNFVAIWKASPMIGTNPFCSSNLYTRFYDYNGLPLNSLYCVININTNSEPPSAFRGDAQDLSISTLYNGDFLLSWTDLNNISGNYRVLNQWRYNNQPPSLKLSLNFVNSSSRQCGNLSVPDEFILISEKGNPGQSFPFNFGSYFDPDPEGAPISYTINKIVGFYYTNISEELTSKPLNPLPSEFSFNPITGNLNFQFNVNNPINLFQIGASDPYGANSIPSYVCIEIQEITQGTESTWDKARPYVSSALSSVSGVFLAVWAYMWNQYRLKKYREFQHPFASEIHECLNLSYSDFSSGPGKEYADIVSLMLQAMRQKTQRDIQKLRTAQDTDNRLLYHYYVFLFAKEILRLSGSMELLRNTAICGIELKGPFASREILLADFKAEADNIIGDVLTAIERAPQPPTEWKETFTAQETSEEKEKNSTACRDKMRRTCCPFQRSDTFRMFQMKALMSKGLSSSQHGEIFSETKSPRAMSSSRSVSREAIRQGSDLFTEFSKKPQDSNLIIHEGIQMSAAGSGVDNPLTASI